MKLIQNIHKTYSIIKDMFNIGGETYSIVVTSNLGKKSCNINLI